MLAVLGFNGIGDAVRDILDPRTLNTIVEEELSKVAALRRSCHG